MIVLFVWIVSCVDIRSIWIGFWLIVLIVCWLVSNGLWNVSLLLYCVLILRWLLVCVIIIELVIESLNVLCEI